MNEDAEEVGGGGGGVAGGVGPILRQYSQEQTGGAEPAGCVPPTLVFAEHEFVKTRFARPTWCRYCGNFILGLGMQGYECRRCKYDVHRGKCHMRANRLACAGEGAYSSEEEEEREETDSFFSHIRHIDEDVSPVTSPRSSALGQAGVAAVGRPPVPARKVSHPPVPPRRRAKDEAGAEAANENEMAEIVQVEEKEDKANEEDYTTEEETKEEAEWEDEVVEKEEEEAGGVQLRAKFSDMDKVERVKALKKELKRHKKDSARLHQNSVEMSIKQQALYDEMVRERERTQSLSVAKEILANDIYKLKSIIQRLEAMGYD